MDFANPRMREVFFDLYEGLPRVGPGNAESTLRALKMVGRLPDEPEVLDLGCGPGKQTFDLADAMPTARILAVDLHRPFLDRIAEETGSRGIGCRIEVLQADMSKLDLGEGSFDLIWSEGAAYSIGFGHAVDCWRPLLRNGGYLVVSEATWFSRDRPQEIVDFWSREYPDMLDVEGCIDLVARAGFEVIGSFALPEDAWWQDFYTPMFERLEQLERRYEGDAVAESVLQESRQEIEIFRRSSSYSGYTFIVARKASA